MRLMRATWAIELRRPKLKTPCIIAHMQVMGDNFTEYPLVRFKSQLLEASDTMVAHACQSSLLNKDSCGKCFGRLESGPGI